MTNIPEGAELVVEDVAQDKYDSYLNAAAEALNTNADAFTYAKLLDISIVYEGQEIQPNGKVGVEIQLKDGEDVTNPQVVHFGKDPEVLDATKTDNGVAFATTGFSVYAVVDDSGSGNGKPYRVTYEFYNADDTPYHFKDSAGRDQYTQILKNGEVLEDVGIPTKGASKNAKFIGWFDEDGTQVQIGVAQTVTENKTVKLTAKLQGIVNVFFVTAVMEDEGGDEPGGRSIVTVKQVEYTVGQSGPITVDTSDITTDAPTTEQAVIGWNRNENAANEGVAEGSDGVITLFENGNDKNIGDVMLFPAIADAHWLYFDENDGGTGGGASYTPPQFVLRNGVTHEPTAPHRTGYTFGGWYTDSQCTTPFAFGNKLNANTRVYAKWNGSSTTYSIIVWVQRTEDSASLPTNGNNLPETERTYDFYRAYSVNANTGSTATVANTYKQLGTELDADGHIKYNRCDTNKTVAADGSTVMNVYYDRDVMTIHWRNSRYGSEVDTWYGLYNATFAEARKTWKTGTWRSPMYPISVMDSFVDFDTRTDTELILYPDSESGSYHLYFYKETLSGTYERVYDGHMSGNTNVTLAEKYKPGFELDSYTRNSSTSYPSSPSSGWRNATAGSTVNNNYSNVHVRYARSTFDIEYHNGTKGTEGSILRTDHVKYEASLVGHSNPTVEYPVEADSDHYDFIGWFADSSWSTLVTFTELSEEEKTNYTNWYGVQHFIVISKMPSHNFPLYAGYALKGWDCALNPNEGTFTNTNQAGVFWLQYGDKFSSDLKTGITREGYAFLGWMVSDVPLKADGSLDLKNVTTDDNNHRFVGDFSNWTETDTPWQFDTGITGPVALTAKWFYKSAMNVVYNANGGSNAPEDNGEYSDHATTVAFAAPTAPEKKVFIGWDIVGTDEEEHLQPGATFKVDSEYAVQGTVTLKAVYHEFNPEEEVPASHIDWYSNFDTNEMESDAPIQVNENVAIRAANTFKRKGYRFVGWARVPVNVSHPDGIDKPAVVLGDKAEEYLYLKYENGKFKLNDPTSDYNSTDVTYIAADELKPYHDMYALWEEVYEVTIEKKVEGITTSDKFTINYTFDDTSSLPGGSVTLAHKGKETLKTEVPKGTVITITETAKGYDQAISAAQTDKGRGTAPAAVSGKDDSFTINGDTTITVTNTRQKGSLRIEKFTAPANINNAKTFKVSVKNTSDQFLQDTSDISFGETERWFDVSVDAPLTIENLPTDTYEVKEDTTPSLVDIEGYRYDNTSYSVPKAEIKKGETATVTVTNHYTKLYKVTIQKKVEGVATSDEFNIKYAFSDTSLTGGSVNLKNGNSETLKQLVPEGTNITITETAANYDPTITAAKTEGGEGQGPADVSAGVFKIQGDTTITVTNARHSGTLEIVKKTAPENIKNDKVFKVSVQNSAGQYLQNTSNISFGTDKKQFDLSVTYGLRIANLPTDTYVVEEDTSDTAVAIDGYRYDKTDYEYKLGDTASESAVVEKGKTTTVTVTNNYTQLVDVTVTKTLNDPYDKTSRSFRFKPFLTEGGTDVTEKYFKDLTDGKFEITTPVITDGEGRVTATKTFEGIPVGATLTVTEELDPNYETTVSPTGNVTIAEAGHNIVFTNTRKTAKLTIEKVVDGDTKYVDFSKAYVINVTVGGTTTPITLKPEAASKPATQEITVPYGAEYSVDEENPGNQFTVSYKVNGTAAQKVSGKIEEDTTVTVTNTAKDVTETGVDINTGAAKTALLALFAFAMMCVLGFSLKRRYVSRR